MKPNHKKPSRGNFESLGDVLGNVMRRWRQSNDMVMLQIWDVWEACVGSQVAANARPAAFKGNRLIVHVTGSAWLHQLQFLKTDIIETVNRACPEARITDLRFKIGSLERF